ncbi:hypothetical protein L1987_38606 [Smallanthus sonchifolius]|uniref:Uncharacterized protein n=1 Tax=Smallanthus sonchifolius TaxID=185202 RepID=A0ACB9HJN2_9ASTR|nr:hypothetical protein L1987_38606 [Smallanthus sonchifolius]
MKLRSFISTCSATICTATDDATTIQHPQKSRTPTTPKLAFSDTISSISDTDTSYSLHSNLSLQTLPSIPSLQKLSLETLNLAVSHGYLTSLKPSPAAHVNFLAVNNNLLYAASGNLIHVFDTTSFTLVDIFSVNESSSDRNAADARRSNAPIDFQKKLRECPAS